MSYRKNDVNGQRSDAQHAESIGKFTDFESRMAPVVRQTIKDVWGKEYDLVDHGVDNSGKQIESDEEFKQKGGGAFDWKITKDSKELVVDAQVHTKFCPCITLKHDKLEKADRDGLSVFLVEEDGLVWLKPKASKHIMDNEIKEPQSSIGDKEGYRFHTGRVNFMIRQGWAVYIPYSTAALAIVDLGCFPKKYSDEPRAYATNR